MSVKKRIQESLNRSNIAETWKARMALVKEKTGEDAKKFCSAEGISEYTYNRAANDKAEPTEETVVAVELGFKKRRVPAHPHMMGIINEILKRYDNGGK